MTFLARCTLFIRQRHLLFEVPAVLSPHFRPDPNPQDLFMGFPLISCTQKRNPSASCIPVLSLNSWQNYCTVTWIETRKSILNPLFIETSLELSSVSLLLPLSLFLSPGSTLYPVSFSLALHLFLSPSLLPLPLLLTNHVWKISQLSLSSTSKTFIMIIPHCPSFPNFSMQSKICLSESIINIY